MRALLLVGSCSKTMGHAILEVQKRISLTEAGVIFALAVTGFVLYHLYKWLRIVIAVWNIPGPKPRFILGHVHYINNHNKMRMIGETATQQFGPMAKFWISIFPAVFLTSPEYIQPVLNSYKHNDKIFFYRLLHNFVGKGLITQNGAIWKRHRKLIQPLFRLKMLQQFLGPFYEGSNRLVTKLQECNGPVNITSYVNDCVLSILHEVVLGVPLERTGDLSTHKKSIFTQGEDMVLNRLSHPWMLIDWIYCLTSSARKESKRCNDIHNYIREIVRERKSRHRDQPTSGIYERGISFLDMLLVLSEKYEDFNEDHVVNQACTLMLAGQESVATAVTLCLYSLARHPDVQERLFKEVVDVLGDYDEIPTLANLSNMTYLVKCIKETMRLYPSVPIFARNLSEDLTLGQCTLPAGTIVCVSPFITHRIPEIYPDPGVFDPERFSPENESSRHPFAYIPFSAGPRICIGNKFSMLEMEIMISSIVKHFKLSLVKGKEDVTLKYRMTLRAKGGVWLKFQRRDA